jgi:hypothetical protein
MMLCDNFGRVKTYSIRLALPMQLPPCPTMHCLWGRAILPAIAKAYTDSIEGHLIDLQHGAPDVEQAHELHHRIERNTGDLFAEPFTRVADG